MSENFLAAMLSKVHTATAAQRFEKVLREVFEAFSKLKFEEGVVAMEGALIRLDLATRDSLPLTQSLVRALLVDCIGKIRRCVFRCMRGYGGRATGIASFQGQGIAPIRPLYQ